MKRDISQLVRWLAGQKVVKAEFESDQLFLSFSDCGNILIYNPSEIKIGEERINVDKLPGAVISGASFDGDILYINTHNAIKITVDMRDEKWRGPEALRVENAEGKILIWND